jgi:chromatin remodeling complex protein RSC6
MSAYAKRKAHQEDSPRDKRRRQEIALDDALKSTFPASDPVSMVQPAGRDFPGSKPLIKGGDDNRRGLKDSQ